MAGPLVAASLSRLAILLVLATPGEAQTAYGHAFREGWTAMEGGAPAEARGAFENCLDLVPENPTATSRARADGVLAEGADVADVEIRAIGKRGIAGWPVLRTFHRSEKPPVLGD